MSPAFDPAPRAPAWCRRLGSRAARFLTGQGLPVFLVMAAATYELFLLLVIFAPAGWGVWSAFSDEFKIWCFNYDPRTGGMEWMAVAIMVAEPPFIVGLMLAIWRFGRSKDAMGFGWWHHRRAAAVGMGVGLFAVGGLYAYGRPSTEAEPVLPFPGQRIRTALPPPEFSLTDHRGAPLALADLRGRVTLVTGVYALCSTTCPQILVQVRELLDSLPPEARDRLDVVVLSLNPEYDTAALMGGVAEAYGFEYPRFKYLNGDPAAMKPLLRDFQFAARRDPETGIVEHANLFILVDADARIAYRFNLDRRHAGWLRDGALALMAELDARSSRK